LKGKKEKEQWYPLLPKQKKSESIPSVHLKFGYYPAIGKHKLQITGNNQIIFPYSFFIFIISIVIQAANIKDEMDTLVKVELPNFEAKISKTIKSNKNPIWNETLEFLLNDDSLSSTIEVSLLSSRIGGKDILGYVQ
jgi:hypothetical protein